MIERPDGRWHTVINGAGTRSLWPADRPIPGGWHAYGSAKPRDEALAAIGAGWTDPRPAGVGTPS